MTLFQAFPDVWLPRGIDMDVGMLFAVGPISSTTRSITTTT